VWKSKRDTEFENSLTHMDDIIARSTTICLDSILYEDYQWKDADNWRRGWCVMEAGAAQNYSISCTTGFGYSAQKETYTSVLALLTALLHRELDTSDTVSHIDCLEYLQHCTAKFKNSLWWTFLCLSDSHK